MARRPGLRALVGFVLLAAIDLSAGTQIATNAIWRQLVSAQAPAPGWAETGFDDSAGSSGPVLTIVASDPDAREPYRDPISGVEFPGDAAMFVLTRTGDLDSAIAVWLAFSGTASNGLDLAAIQNPIVMPPGVHTTWIGFMPAPDNLTEGDETLTLTVVPDPAYRLGEPNQATVFIADSDAVTTNRPPFVSIITPTNGSVATLPANVVMQARAIDPDGMVTQVEFFDGTNRLGIVRLPPIVILNETDLGLEPLLPSGLSPFSLIWTNPPPGIHTLRAVAMDNRGAVGESSPIIFTVLPAVARPAPRDQKKPAVAASGDLYLVVWADQRDFSRNEWDIYGTRVTRQGQVLDPSGIRICAVTNIQGDPAVASDGHDFLVVWNDARAEYDSTDFDVFGARVTANGVVLDPDGFPISQAPQAQFYPSIAFGRTNYLLAWYDYRNSTADRALNDIFGARVSPDGIVLDPGGIAICTADDMQWAPGVAAFEDGFFVAWDDARFPVNAIRGTRVSPAGLAANPDGLVLSPHFSGYPIRVAANAAGYLAVWTDGRDYGTTAYNIFGHRVTSAGAPVGEDLVLSGAAGMQVGPAVAGLGSEFFAVWLDDQLGYTNTRVMGTRVNSSGAVNVSGIPIGRAASSSSLNLPGIAGQGEQYLVVWVGGDDSGYGNTDIVGARVSAAGAVLDTNAFLISTLMPQTPIVTWPAPAPITYGTALGTNQLRATANVPGTFAYDPPFGAVLAAGLRTLSATFTPFDQTMYHAVTAQVTVQVNPAPLIILAEHKTRYVGQPNPLLTATYSGLVAGDDPGDLDVPVTLTTPATVDSAAGSYPIVVTGGSDPNYAVTRINGTLTVLSTPADCLEPPPDLAAWWRAENNAADAMGGHDGALFGQVTFAPGRVGQAFRFDGGSFVEVPDAPSLRLTEELTIEFWVRRDRVDEPHYIIEKGGDWTRGVQNYAVALHTGAYNHCLHFLFAGGWRGGGSIADTNWHHCAVTARNGDADPVLYIDGIVQPVIYGEGASRIQLYPSMRPLHLGAQIDSQSGWFYYHRGLIDELSLYRRALSAAEIEAVYRAGSFGKCAATDVRLPVITRQPASLTRTIGETAVFSLIATGAPPLCYQWHFNDLTLLGATNSVLVIGNVQPGHAGNYRAVVANPFGSVTSAVAALTVVTPGLDIPRIVSFMPRTAPAGTPMTIVGTNFNPIAGLNTVYFGAVRATVTSASASVLHVRVPPGATYAPISVTVNGRTGWSREPFAPTFTGSGVMEASSFAPWEEDLSTGDGPVHIAVADLDGDGKPDLAVANRFEHTLSIYRSVSAPGVITPQSFAPRFQMPTGLNPTGVVAADLDGDGRLDLVTVNADANTVSIFRNLAVPGSLAAESFAPRVDVATGRQPVAVAVGDLDGDGRPDIVTANHGADTMTTLSILALPGGPASNAFARRIDFEAGPEPHSIALGDLNHDGRLDAVVGNFSANRVSVLPNQRTPGDPLPGFTFGNRVEFSGGGRTVAIGDVDGDGGPDIVSGSWTGNTLSLLRMNFAISASIITTNSFLPAVTLNTGGYTHNVALGDLDGDGRPDLAVVTEMPSQLLLYHNGSEPGSLAESDWAQQAHLGTGWNAVGVALADFDLDGRLDVVFANHYDDTIRIHRNATGTNAVTRSFVVRKFPKTFPPGRQRVINLVAAPAATVSVYSVEDQPPAGWVVGMISHEGLFDARTGKVKFGPFFDAAARALHYTVTPPSGFLGAGHFSGMASADGANSPIVGFDRMFIAGPHPADREPSDWMMTISEVTAYGAAWRRGQAWPVPPNPIPMDYVTRAGALWRLGECYRIEPAIDTGPLWWVACATSNLQGGPVAAAAPGIPMAVRQAPTAFVPGEPLPVALVVTPADAAGAFAVEEHLPAGWGADTISHGGEFDTVAGVVRWGPFFEAAPRMLSYRATPSLATPDAVAFEGRASFDGTSVAVTGAASLRPLNRLMAVGVSVSGAFRFSVEGRAGGSCVIETSVDLVNWTVVDAVSNPPGPIEFIEPAALKSSQRFYRVRFVE